MRRFSFLIIGLILLIPLHAQAQGTAPAGGRDCVTSPAVRREISQLDKELNARAATIKNECAPGTIGRAEQAYFEFLSISVDTSEVMDSLKSLVDISQNHSLAHDIAEYEAALDRIDAQGKRAMESCSSALGTSLTALKQRYINGDEDADQNNDDAVGGLKRLKQVLDPHMKRNKFYQAEPNAKGVMASYYDKDSVYACTLPRYGLAEFKTVFTRLRDTLKNFKNQAAQIKAREGPTLYQEFLTQQQLLDVRDFRQALQRDERSNQVVGSQAVSTQDGRVSDHMRNTEDVERTLSGMVREKLKEAEAKKEPARISIDGAVYDTERRSASYRELTPVVDDAAKAAQLFNRAVGTHFTQLEALLEETDQILKVDLCRETLKAANFMVKACERTSYCPGQICDEAEPMRGCSP